MNRKRPLLHRASCGWWQQTILQAQEILNALPVDEPIHLLLVIGALCWATFTGCAKSGGNGTHETPVGSDTPEPPAE